MTCYRKGGCGPYEMYPCNICPASKPEHLQREQKKPKTEADRIRAMTDEEIAAMLSTLGGCPLFHGMRDCPEGHSPTGNCYPRACWLELLKKEADNG